MPHEILTIFLTPYDTTSREMGYTRASSIRSPAWHLLKIETYPRNAFTDVDDLKAEAKMTALVAGP